MLSRSRAARRALITGALSLALAAPATVYAHGRDGVSLDRRGQPAGSTELRSGSGSDFDPAAHDGVKMTADAADLSSLPKVHVIYLVPSDGADRFSAFAAMFQRDAERSSGNLELSFARGIRFDYRPDSRDPIAKPILDVSFMRSKNNTRKLGGTNQFSVVVNEVTAKFTDPDKKYLVYVDAPSKYCGQSHMAQDTKRTTANYNERSTVSTIYRYYDSTNADGGFCHPVLHELSHAMGAVQSVAPNASGSHCDDYGNDAMCLFASAIPYDSSKGIVYDYGNDDYWDPVADPADGRTATLAWWTVNLSRFICPPAAGSDPIAGPRIADCSKPNVWP